MVDYALLRPTRTLRRWLEENKKEAREPRDACDVLWRCRRPDVRVCDAAHLRQRGVATWHDAVEARWTGAAKQVVQDLPEHEKISYSTPRSSSPELLRRQSFQLFSRRCGIECVLASCRCCSRVRLLGTRHDLGGSSKCSNALW